MAVIGTFINTYFFGRKLDCSTILWHHQRFRQKDAAVYHIYWWRYQIPSDKGEWSWFHHHSARAIYQRLEEYLLEHIEEDFQAYNLNVERSQVNPPARIDTARLKSKMSKLKDLYLNNLIDRDEYELDYTRLKQELVKASAVQQPIKLIDIKKFQDIRRTYATLDPEHKKAFWSRAIEKIIVDESGNLQIFPANFLLKSL